MKTEPKRFYRNARTILLGDALAIPFVVDFANIRWLADGWTLKAFPSALTPGWDARDTLTVALAPLMALQTTGTLSRSHVGLSTTRIIDGHNTGNTNTVDVDLPLRRMHCQPVHRQQVRLLARW